MSFTRNWRGELEIVRHTLLQLGFPLQEIYHYTDAVRHDHYDLHINTNEEHRLLHNLIDAAYGIEIHWFRIPEGNILIGRTLAEANLRARTGASVVALLREGELVANPKSMTVFQAGDRVGLIGDPQEIEQVEKLRHGSGESQIESEQIMEDPEVGLTTARRPRRLEQHDFPNTRCWNGKSTKFWDNMNNLESFSEFGTMNFMKYETVQNVTLPKIGFGTWSIGGNSHPDPDRDAASLAALHSALEVGYTHFDTAEAYAAGHSEELIGQAIRETKIKREALFITTKVSPEHLSHSDVLRSFENSLRHLGMEYVDLYLIHWPGTWTNYEQTFRALNKMVREGKVRHLGVSNFKLKLLKKVQEYSETPIFNKPGSIPHSGSDLCTEWGR